MFVYGPCLSFHFYKMLKVVKLKLIVSLNLRYHYVKIYINVQTYFTMKTLSETEFQSVDYRGSAQTEPTLNCCVWCSMPYLDCRSWRGCCCQAQRRSEPGCPATPGRTPGSRGGTVPRRRGKTPPSCWWVRRLLWGRGTAKGWDGAALPPCFSMWPESRCSSWGYTSLPGQRGEMVRDQAEGSVPHLYSGAVTI